MTSLGTANFFFVFGGITGISVIYFFFFIGETKYLTDKEKKELYVPGGSRGRKLKPGEKSYKATNTPLLESKNSELYGIARTTETTSFKNVDNSFLKT